MAAEPIIATTLNGAAISRDRVQQYEARRTKAVLKKFISRLGPRAITDIAPDVNPETTLRGDLQAQRVALLALKTGLGHGGIYAMLRREIVTSERISRIAVAASRGRTVHSMIHLTASDIDAQGFAEWFNNLVVLNDEAAMIAAMADHYLLRGLPDGRQEVVETTGGSPAATRFLVDYTAADQLTVQPAPDYPIQIAGHAVFDDGLVIGGVRHQLRSRNGDLEALLTVQFPALTPPPMVAAHRWHLAVEFSNWIVAFARTS